MRHLDPHDPTSTETQIVLKMDPTLSERRLLDEIGNMSCDELAIVLVKRNAPEPAVN